MDNSIVLQHCFFIFLLEKPVSKIDNNEILCNASRSINTQSVVKGDKTIHAVAGSELTTQKKFGDLLKKSFTLSATALAKSMNIPIPEIDVFHTFDDEAEIYVKAEESDLNQRLLEAGLPSLPASASSLIKAAAEALEHIHTIQSSGETEVIRRSDLVGRYFVERDENVLTLGCHDTEELLRAINKDAGSQPAQYNMMGEEIRLPPKLRHSVSGTRSDRPDPEYYGTLFKANEKGIVGFRYLDQSGRCESKIKKSPMELRIREEGFAELFEKACSFLGKRSRVRVVVTPIIPAGGAIYGELDAIEEDVGMPEVRPDG